MKKVFKEPSIIQQVATALIGGMTLVLLLLLLIAGILWSIKIIGGIVFLG